MTINTIVYYLAYVDTSTNEIKHVDINGGVTPEEGVSEDGSERIVHIYDNLTEMDMSLSDFCNTRYFNPGTGAFMSRSNRPNEYYDWDSTITSWIINRDGLLSHIRGIRNDLLLSTDWTQNSDSPLSIEQKEEARIYRQELRDFMATVATLINDTPEVYGNLDNIPWPVAPTFLA